jgi:hypothetical protein
MDKDLIRQLVDARDRAIQKSRIQFQARLFAVEEGEDSADTETVALLQSYMERFERLEKELDKDISLLVQQYDIYDHVSAVTGIGPTIAAKLIAMIDIERAPTVSALWRYAGLAVINGKSERPVKGQKLRYNKRLKTVCTFLIPRGFLMAKSPYADVFYSARAFYSANRPDWTKDHVRRAANRKMVKLFMSHLWLRWRQLEGLSTNKPYVHEKLGHVHNYPPEDFGWPVLD